MISPSEVEGFRENYLNTTVESLLNDFSKALENSILHNSEPKNNYTISVSYFKVKPWAVETVLLRVANKFRESGWQITDASNKLLCSDNKSYQFNLTINRQTNQPYR